METGIREPPVRPDTFDAFYREWFASVARSVALVVRDADMGQELAQVGFARLWDRWDEMSSPDHARNFVFRVSLNEARSYLRRRRPLRIFGFDRRRSGSSDPTEAMTNRVAVFEALKSLSVRQRECVVLVDYLGYDAPSAGELLGIAPSTVRVQLTRGRARLRNMLEEET
jgi:RNA polymerase sigma factor (sigma-70 family)